MWFSEYSKFYDILFDRGEFVCWTTTPFGTGVRYFEDFQKSGTVECNFFCINPLKDSRRDVNVTALRNILVEMDNGTFEEQYKIWDESGMPCSTLVHSAGKSLHAIISLETPLSTIEEYKTLAKRIYDKLGGKAIVDTSVGNPSRLSRAPGARRDGKIQELLFVDKRIPNSVLFNWLGPKVEEPAKEPKQWVRLPGLLSDYTNYFLMYGAPEGEWNRQLFLSACDMTRAGYEKERIVELCEAITGHLDASDKRTINSAYTNAKKEI